MLIIILRFARDFRSQELTHCLDKPEYLAARQTKRSSWHSLNQGIKWSDLSQGQKHSSSCFWPNLKLFSLLRSIRYNQVINWLVYNLIPRTHCKDCSKQCIQIITSSQSYAVLLDFLGICEDKCLFPQTIKRKPSRFEAGYLQLLRLDIEHEPNTAENWTISNLRNIETNCIWGNMLVILCMTRFKSDTKKW